MKVLFLRGGVPTDRDPKQIMFSTIKKNEDMWTQLAFQLSQQDEGEILYWGGKRSVRYADNFEERWVNKLKPKCCSFKPDVIFARGGFPQYDDILNAFPKACKIYYGAGKRFYPQSNFLNYNLILNDTPAQQKQTSKMFPKSKVVLWAKPAAENIFKPVESKSKPYHVVMVANQHKRGIKGHEFVFDTMPKDFKMLKLGIVSKDNQKKNKHVDFTGWIPRKEIPQQYAKAKIAIVCCSKVDSCPRVIPEALACNCPLLVFDHVNFWQEKYINKKTGRLANGTNFWNVAKEMIDGYASYSPYQYYKNNLSMQQSVDLIFNSM